MPTIDKKVRQKELIDRHSIVVRVTHWVNLVVLMLLLMSGLQIFNAHPALYWGQVSNFASPWLAIDADQTPSGEMTGFVAVAGHRINTTGFLGFSGQRDSMETRAFPGWITIPSFQSLADGRRWHFFFAWIFVINGAAYALSALIGGHFRRDLLPTHAQWQWKAVWHDVMSHVLFRFPKGDAARSYNVLQKISYLGIVAILLPLMILTGLTMSPGFNAAMPWTVSLLGGRQSARTLHFIVANLIVFFVIVHVAMVFASGAWNNIRSMLTGRYAIDVPAKPP